MPTAKSGYKLKNGSKVPGVTTILSRFKESGALLFWAFEQGKCCERGEIAGLYDKRDSAAEAGTLAHAMVESHINWEPEMDLSAYPESVASAARQGYANYLRWESDNKIVVIKQEMQMISEKHAFGGCPDAIGIDSHGDRCLLDWKTSGGIYVDYLVQCAAYKILHEENHPDEPITGGTHILRFSKEGGDFHHHFFSDLSAAEDLFLLYRRAYEIDKQLKKRL
jgi:hypothetical protein